MNFSRVFLKYKTLRKNNFYIFLGGKDQSFELETKTVTFAVLDPWKYNINYILFQSLKEYTVFQKVFKIILRIPYFFTETFSGGLMLCLITMWAAVGREPYTVILCAFFISEYLFLLFYLDYLLRLGDNYRDCLNLYGKSFVEKYIGNPFSPYQLKNMPRIIGFASSAVALDQCDRSMCSYRCNGEIRERLADYKQSGHAVTPEIIQKVHTEARMNNTPRFSTISDMISSKFLKK